MFRITTLMENSSPKDCYLSEHGLCLLIESANYCLLYDTGSSPSFLRNAESLHNNLTHLDALVLSHGHYDHTGGVHALLASCKTDVVCLGNRFYDYRFSRKKDGLLDISSSLNPQVFLEKQIPVIEVGKKPVSLSHGVWLLSGFSPLFPQEIPPSSVLRQADGRLIPDQFEDEVVVILETNRDLCVVSGCAHNGVVSICKRVSSIFSRPVTTFVGGTHLKEADHKRIAFTCAQLCDIGLSRLAACHCTGEEASRYFENNFDGFVQNHVGSVLTIE